ncbi:hypothetical protein PVAND_008310 [Polypedilum vanderplanki]|uniref:Uncharacterized protein n=1 Tax=Polypedilum vanderplanki TaxID=319348 RepID=A0A9J6CAM1_POLVA|nr:hypothetical protein PVAND_008310 [Polypedilum vanderplanki]
MSLVKEEEEILDNNEFLEEESSNKELCLPDPYRNFLSKFKRIAKTIFSLICDASFVFFSSSFILFGPVAFEMERIRTNEISNDSNSKKYLQEKLIPWNTSSDNSIDSSKMTRNSS